jgi:hypothetical protein
MYNNYIMCSYHAQYYIKWTLSNANNVCMYNEQHDNKNIEDHLSSVQQLALTVTIDKVYISITNTHTQHL